MKYLPVILLILLMLTGAAAANDDAGRESLFSFGAGARAMALGGGFVSIANDASAIYYNPAGLASLDYHELSFMHADLFEGTIYNYGVWAYPVSSSDGIGIAFMRIGTDDIMRRVDGFDAGKFSFSTSQALLTYGRRFGRRLSVGVTLKAVNQSLDNLSDWTVGADVGATFRLHRWLSVGAVVRDVLQPELKLDATAEPIPRSVALGAALRDFALINHTTLTASIEAEKIDSRDIKMHLGGELSFYNTYMLRAGVDRNKATLGAGLKAGPLKIDYAYRQVDYVDNIHIFSVSFLLGKPTSERFLPPTPIVIQAAPPPPLTPEERELRDLTRKATDFFHALHLDSALFYYRQVLEKDPDNTEIRQTITSIELDLQQRAEANQQRDSAFAEIRQVKDRYLSQARGFEQKKYYAAALDMLDLVLDIEPQNPVALERQRIIGQVIQQEISTNRATADKALRENRTADAIDALGRILELDPSDEAVRDQRQKLLSGLDIAQQLNIGIDLYKRGRYPDASRRFQAALKLDAGNAVAKEYLGLIESIRTRPSTLEDLQKNPEVWQLYLEGIRYMRDKQYQQAIDAWQKVLEAFPGNEDTKNNIDQATLRLKSEKAP
jgi:tetratricopeptide (TPR) repeat protein